MHERVLVHELYEMVEKSPNKSLKRYNFQIVPKKEVLYLLDMKIYLSK